MKKLIFFALLLGIGLFVSGCVGQPSTDGTQNGTANISGVGVVVFYDPANGGIEEQILQRTAKYLPSAAIDLRCVDYSKIIYGQASQSESACMEKDSAKYDANMQLFENLAKTHNAIVYIYENGTYMPAQASLHPLAMAKNLCGVHAFEECDGLPGFGKLKASIYVRNAGDEEYYGQVLYVLESVNISIKPETKIADEQTIGTLKQMNNIKFLPVMLIENAGEDEQFVLDVYASSISVSGSSYSAKKIGSDYIFSLNAGSLSNYVGDEPLINAVAYVPEGKESAYEGVFGGLSFGGVFANVTYIGINSTAGAALGKESGISYLPILVIDAATLSDTQKAALDAVAAQPIDSEYVTLYVKKVGEKYYAYTSLSSPELFVGEKLQKVDIDLYVMSHCPFGLQMQKAFIPVIEAFKDSGRLIVNNKFVSYTMHGEEETKDNLYQYCVGKKLPEKEWDFIKCFAENNGDELLCMQQLDIDSVVVDSCVNDARTEFGISGTSFPIYASENSLYKVQGSPTTVFMGKQVNLQRSPEAIKEFVCSMLAEPLPAACSQNLSSAQADYGFGPVAGSGTSTSSATCG